MARRIAIQSATGGEVEAVSPPPPPPVSLRVGPLAALSRARAYVRRLLRRVAAVGDVRGAVEAAALVGPRQRRPPATIDRDRDGIRQVAIAVVHRAEDPVRADAADVHDAARRRGL